MKLASRAWTPRECRKSCWMKESLEVVTQSEGQVRSDLKRWVRGEGYETKGQFRQTLSSEIAIEQPKQRTHREMIPP